MKKILSFLLFALCLTVAANAQSSCETPTNVTVTPGATSATVSWTGSSEQYNVLYSSNFYCSADDIDGWAIYDVDGDGYSWYLANNGRSGADDDIAFVSDSYYYGALDPDNWLITPIINLGGTMSVWMKSYSPSYLDTFAIYLTTDLDFDEVEDFNIPLVVKSVAPDEWTEYTADLSAYAGQQGYIAIRHFNSYDQYALLMDDFRVDGEGIMLSNVSSPVELPGLIPEAQNQVQVQAICTSGVSEWSDPVEFTTHGLCDVPSSLSVTPSATTASLEWTGYQDQYTVRYQTLESYNSYLASGMATVTLTIGDVWGDGSGYQMLLDADATAYGDIIPETGGLTTSGDASEAVYAEFEYKIPANADGLLNTSNIVFNNSVTISIPAGIYDFCITNPTPGDRMWIASNNGTVNGREDDYVFEAGKTYEFEVTPHGSNDGVDVTITSNIPEDSWTKVTNVSNPAEISGLNPETTYVVQVQGICEDGVSVWSEPVEFTTEEEPACVISEVNVIGYEPPVAGENSQDHLNITVPDNANYFLVESEYSPSWYDEDAGYFFFGTFVAGTRYSFGVEIHANDGCVFANNCRFYFDGADNLVDPELTGVGEDNTIAYIWTMPEQATGTTSPCEAPTNLTATNITGFDATLGWTDNNNADVWYVDMDEYGDGEWAYYASGKVYSNPFSFHDYFALTPGKTYRYRVQSICSDENSSDFSGYYLFTTMEYCDAEVPTNLTTSDITAHTATVEWTENPDNYYNVRYMRAIFFEDFENNDYEAEDNSLPSGWTTIDADGDGNNWYYNEANERAYSGIGVATSASYINFEGALTPDNWLITPKIDLNGTMRVWLSGHDPDYAAEHFAIYLSTSGNTVDDFTETLVLESIATDEYVEYTADLSAYAGQQGYIAIRHFNVTDMYRLNVDDFGVFLDDDLTPDWTTETVTGNSIELTGLEQGSHYLVQVQSVCNGDATSLPNSSLWSTVEFTTTEEAEPCETPTNLTATNITATSAKLGWTGNLEQYTVRYKDGAASDWTTATTANSTLALTGLTPATTYTSQVQGDCGSGAKSVTDWSDPVTFTTLSGTVEPGECGPAVDCEGTSYPTVKIGDVCWMTKNLAAEACVTTGNVYSYVNDQFPDEDANVETYGLLYDEEAAFATGICPEGYTLPTTEQFEYLKNNFTVEELRNSTGWVVNTGTNGTGFSWDGSGFRNGMSETFDHMLMEGYLWAVDMTSGTPQPAMYKMMYYCNEIVRVYDFNGISASVRCVKIAEPQPEPEPETFTCGTDNLIIGENSYETVQIGTQCWTKTNMREPVGEEIVSGNAEYPATEAYHFKVPSRDLAIYGYLYNWKAANQVCPEGWHLPTDAEWTQMENVLSTIPIDPDATGDRGDHLGKLAAYDENWDPSSTPNTPGYTEPFDDRNLSGFSARPMGYYWKGFDAQTRYAQFWTATENPEDTTKAYDRWMGYLYTSVQRYSHSKTFGYSVRCVRDSE